MMGVQDKGYDTTTSDDYVQIKALPKIIINAQQYTSATGTMRGKARITCIITVVVKRSARTGILRTVDEYNI